MSSSCPIEMYCLVILLVREFATKTSETHQGCWRRIYGLDFRWDYWWRRKIRRLWWNDVFRSPTENLMVHQGSASKAKSTITIDEIKWLTNRISHQDNISYKDKRKTKAKWNDYKFIQNRRRKHTTRFSHDNIDYFHWLCSVLGPITYVNYKLNSLKSVRWSAVPVPCLSRLSLKLKGK